MSNFHIFCKKKLQIKKFQLVRHYKNECIIHFLSMINVNFDKQSTNPTENAKVLFVSKLEEEFWTWRVVQYYNITKSTVQRIKHTI
jgi:lipoprotein NlpI